jgi:hypothetical protein
MNAVIKSVCHGAAIAMAVLSLGVLVIHPVSAAVYAYPLKKQSPAQQQDDERACDRWATERTGFDPRRPPVYQGGSRGAGPSASVNSGIFGRGSYGQGGGLGDAGKGAGLGALGGAIAGDVGAGAAIGALSGLFIGGVKRSSKEQERADWERQQAQQQASERSRFDAQVRQMRAEHDRAYAVCMDGRGYRVN